MVKGWRNNPLWVNLYQNRLVQMKNREYFKTKKYQDDAELARLRFEEGLKKIQKLKNVSN